MSPTEVAASLAELWSPRVIGEVRAEQECLLMLIERKSTLHTGDVLTERTRSIEDQLRQP